MSGVFISYRHSDSWDKSHQLYKDLANALGDEKLFIDAVKIEPGANFAQVINEKVGFCDALIAVIGSDWLSISDEQHRRRIDDPEDWVRLEITSALERGIPVIQVLVDGAAPLEAKQLPQDLVKLSTLQAQKISSEHYEQDMERLLAVLNKIIQPANSMTIWVSLLTRGYKAMDPLDLHRPETLRQSLRFLAYMILIVDILHLPVIPIKAADTISTGFLFAAYFVNNYIEWLAAGIILHFMMRTFGGKSTFQKSITAFCFLSAYLPLFSLSLAPVWALPEIVLKDAGSITFTPETSVETLLEIAQQLGVYGIAKFAVSFILATVILILMLKTMFSALRTLHRLCFGRTVLAFFFSMLIYLTFLFMFYLPLISGVFKAFERAA
jgi:hypothetical protein